jgi:hypothetical protein
LTSCDAIVMMGQQKSKCAKRDDCYDFGSSCEEKVTCESHYSIAECNAYTNVMDCVWVGTETDVGYCKRDCHLAGHCA